MLVLATIVGGLAALMLTGRRAPAANTEPPEESPPERERVNLPDPSQVPPDDAPPAKFLLGNEVRRGGLVGVVIKKEYSPHHGEWLYVLDCPPCPQGGILESDLERV